MKKEIRDWIVILGIFFILYITGAYSEVAAFTQRLVLATGVITPSELAEKDKVPADYNFKLLDLQGNSLDFKDLKGKVIFINFWASWCAPCIAEMPSINNLYEEMKDVENIEFVMISLDQDESKARRFIEKKDYDLPFYFPDYNNLIPKVYEAPSIPTTFVISMDGIIDSKKVGMANYNTKSFKKYLNKLLGTK